MSTLASNLQPARFTPKYVSLARDLLRDIAEKNLSVGDRLATENELADQYQLSRVTVRQALDMLAQEGYISRERARGTFVKRVADTAEQFGLIRGTVLLVCSNEQSAHRSEDAAFTTVLCAIEQTLARHGFAMQLVTVGQNPAEDRARLRAIVARGGLDGVLAIGSHVDPYRELLEDLPVVTSCTFVPQVEPWVGDDVSVACRESVRHLLELGHRRIAMICSAQIDGNAFAVFARGYQEAYEAAGLAWDRSLLFHAYPGESLEALAGNVLAGAARPTGVFCENWRVCRAILKAADPLGLAVPADLSVVGYGQNVLDLVDPVPITAYVPDTARVGEVAADLFARIVGGRQADSPGAATIEGHLELRASTCAVGRAQG